jgi:dTDP-glucose pyrophosphorylase
MKNWKNTLITPATPIREAMKIIDTSSLQIALVTDRDLRLIGVVTDGDIRRGLLKGIALDEPVDLILNRDFTAVGPQIARDEILGLMKGKELRQIPVLDEQGKVVDLKIMDDLISQPDKENWVVIMAGGIGSRLQPLTDALPKPLLKVGNKPLIETIVENFVMLGFRRFYISVNYKADMIETFLGDGARWGADIRYLREIMTMGTAGALGLLPDKPAHPLIVMNGDVLTKINMRHLLDFHMSHKAMATMCIQDYYFKVPFGVVKTKQHRLAGINEKPEHRFYVNAGVYVLEPDVLGLIPKDTPYNMTTLFEKLIELKHETVVFPVREYWIDIGRIVDLEKANGEYSAIFG